MSFEKLQVPRDQVDRRVGTNTSVFNVKNGRFRVLSGSCPVRQLGRGLGAAEKRSENRTTLFATLADAPTDYGVALGGHPVRCCGPAVPGVECAATTYTRCNVARLPRGGTRKTSASRQNGLSVKTRDVV